MRDLVPQPRVGISSPDKTVHLQASTTVALCISRMELCFSDTDDRKNGRSQARWTKCRLKRSLCSSWSSKDRIRYHTTIRCEAIDACTVWRDPSKRIDCH